MRDEITLTDAEIEQRFARLGAGITVDDLVFTRDTLADFDAARLAYQEPGRAELKEKDRRLFLGVQALRGQPRQDLYLIDFGTVRAAYTG